MLLDDAAVAMPLDPGSSAAEDATALDARADRASRVLIVAFVLALCFIGWLGVSGIDATAFADGLFGLSPGGCGGG